MDTNGNGKNSEKFPNLKHDKNPFGFMSEEDDENIHQNSKDGLCNPLNDEKEEDNDIN